MLYCECTHVMAGKCGECCMKESRGSGVILLIEGIYIYIYIYIYIVSKIGLL
jgi:hypothetical protein